MPGLDPGIHVFGATRKAWMAGTSPAMTMGKRLGKKERGTPITPSEYPALGRISALGKSLLDHELRGLAVIALDEAALVQEHASVGDQRRAPADHDAVMFGLERR